MREIQLEGKKYLFTGKMLVFVVVLVIINIIKLSYFCFYDSSIIERKILKSNKMIEKERVSYEGEIEEEKTKKMILKADNYENFLLSGGGKENLDDKVAYLLRDSVERQYNYHLTMKELLNKIQRSRENYESKHNKYGVMQCNRMTKRYSDRFINDYYDCKDFKQLLKYNFSTCMLLLAGIFASFSFFYQEKVVGTDLLITSCGKNRIKIMRNKMFCSVLFMLIVAILLFGSDVFIYSNILHLRGWLQPIYAVEGYEYSVFNCSILSYYLLERLICFLTCVVASWLTAIIAERLLFGKYTVIITVLMFAFFVYIGDYVFVPERYFSSYYLKRIFDIPMYLYEINLLFLTFLGVFTIFNLEKKVKYNV